MELPEKEYLLVKLITAPLIDSENLEKSLKTKKSAFNNKGSYRWTFPKCQHQATSYCSSRVLKEQKATKIPVPTQGTQKSQKIRLKRKRIQKCPQKEKNKSY
ncbi:hypothetical protein AYI68_g8237 [Smittium mucronatum]|uniref:Uncharacterized protein n=1 Tax=Smittium mucronatum TaxID=133383 RepID=A0A1R0GLG2_9FUNG|nr:hypothetical protein AYI68_g8237 [Smittium mucronatum]